MTLTYRLGNDVGIDAVIDVLRSSTLGDRRPVDDRAAIEQMMTAANLVVTAWDDGKLVGLARSLSDFCFCTYLSDLAVRLEYQRQGIGKELIRRTRKAGNPPPSSCSPLRARAPTTSTWASRPAVGGISRGCLGNPTQTTQRGGVAFFARSMK